MDSADVSDSNDVSPAILTPPNQNQAKNTAIIINKKFFFMFLYIKK